MSGRIDVGARVLVPWGVDRDRDGVVVEVWGPPDSPSHVRVALLDADGNEDGAPLLLPPRVLKPVATT